MQILLVLFRLYCLTLAITNVQGEAFDSNESATSNPEELSISDLMKIEVSSVARKSESLSNTAAAAFIISQDDIRRSGATSIPEALRLAPGVEVAQISASRWAVSIRGFNGEYANKLLVLMDGRTLFTPLFSGVFWDQQDTLMEDIERIEIIRGPGAVMWGSNAVNGVINIITKKAKDTQGNLFVAGGGNQEQGFIGYRHGGRVNNDGLYRVYAKAFDRDAYLDADGLRSYDDWRSAQAGFRYDDRLSNDHRFTVQGDVYRLKKGCQSQPYTIEPPFNTSFTEDCYGDGANMLARWEATLENGSELKLQGYYDRVSFNAVATANIQDTFDIDFQHLLHPSRGQDLMWGLNYRFIHSASENTPVIDYHPSELGFHQGSVFLQDEIALIENTLRLTLGSKVEESHFGGTQIQPNARLLWTPNNSHSVWASVSRASRIPSQGSATSNIAAGTTSTQFGFFNVPVQLMIMANPDLKAEKVLTGEIGLRSQWASNFFTDLTAFTSDYSDQIVLRQGGYALQFSPLQATQNLVWSNQNEDITVRGIELSSDWQALDWTRFFASYSYLDIENANAAGSSPKHHGALRWQMDLTDQIKVDSTMRYVGELSDIGVSAYTAFDARLAYQPFKGIECSLTMQNLFAPQHFEFNDSPVTASTAYSLAVPRSIYAKLRWDF